MYCIYKDSMRGVTVLRPLCIVAVTVAICVEVEHVDGATADFCAGGSGVVKASRSASLGARILTKCGRSMVLKYTLPSKQFYKILTCTCIVTRLCYAHVVPNKNMGEFRRQITKCYMDYSKWFVHARPDIVSEDIRRDVEELTADIENCLVTQMPKDKDTMLGIVRYIRMFFFTA